MYMYCRPIDARSNNERRLFTLPQMSCLDSHPPDQFSQCLKHGGFTATRTQQVKPSGRKLQADQITQPAEHRSDSSQFLDPCASLPANPAAAGWTRLMDNDDLSTAPLSLSFDFSLYGTLYPKNTALVYVNNNGNISFNSSIAEYTANGFPLDNVAMVAPFWSDVDTRGPGNGKVWYKEIGDKTFSVVWDRVGKFRAVQSAGPQSDAAPIPHCAEESHPRCSFFFSRLLQ